MMNSPKDLHSSCDISDFRQVKYPLSNSSNYFSKLKRKTFATVAKMKCLYRLKRYQISKNRKVKKPHSITNNFVIATKFNASMQFLTPINLSFIQTYKKN